MEQGCLHVLNGNARKCKLAISHKPDRCLMIRRKNNCESGVIQPFHLRAAEVFGLHNDIVPFGITAYATTATGKSFQYPGSNKSAPSTAPVIAQLGIPKLLPVMKYCNGLATAGVCVTAAGIAFTRLCGTQLPNASNMPGNPAP